MEKKRFKVSWECELELEKTTWQSLRLYFTLQVLFYVGESLEVKGRVRNMGLLNTRSLSLFCLCSVFFFLTLKS